MKSSSATTLSVRHQRLRWLLYFSVPVLLLAFGIWRVFFVNPLPKDEELIAHFQGHRKDIDVLIRAYYAERVSSLWDSSPEIKAIMARARVSRVHPVMGHWPPDPYSEEAYRMLFAIDVRTPDGRYKLRQHEALQIDIDDDRYFQSVLRYPGDLLIWKALLYIPAIADTRGGKLWPLRAPKSEDLLTDDQYERSAYRLLPGLNRYPPDWHKGECVFRQLEVHWFIVMCRAA